MKTKLQSELIGKLKESERMSAEDVLCDITQKSINWIEEGFNLTSFQALKAMHEYANQFQENKGDSWECIRCHKIHSYLKQSCDCQPETKSASILKGKENSDPYWCIEMSINSQSHWWTGSIPHLSIEESERQKPMWTTNIQEARKFKTKSEAEIANKGYIISGEATEHIDILEVKENKGKIKFPTECEIKLSCPQSIIQRVSCWIQGAKWMQKEVIKRNNLEVKENEGRRDGSLYHLNCDKCGSLFWSKESFPEPQICPKCLNKHL